MDIIVEGVGKKFYNPGEVEINLNFYTRDDLNLCQVFGHKTM